MKTYLLSALLVGVAMALPTPDERLQYEPQQYQPEPPRYKPAPYKEEPPKPYAFDYGVRDDYSGANYGHSETSNGNTIEGSYQVALPDGRIQTVKYIADHKNGFQAQVEYEGEARYPEEPYKQEEPQYKPQPPRYKPQPQYKSAPQKYQPREEQQLQYQEAEETPVYLGEIPEYAN